LHDFRFSSPFFLLSVQAYAGRVAAASPAAGSTKIHEAEQVKLLTDAFA
jgi:2-oxoglutarate dehydrogenase complex dehydrogenase (E1) component-like enzyme